MPMIDKTGNRYGTHTVVKYAGRKSGSFRVWVVRCDCGREREMTSETMQRGAWCTCKPHPAITHGLTKTHRQIHGVWSSMKQRCYTKTNPVYPHYGGRGIKVCERWHDFASFVEDMGPRPEGKPRSWSVERVDQDGDYCPENCHWASNKEQGNNRRNNVLVTYQGRTQTISQWADELPIPYDVIRNRLRKFNWPVERALSEPVRQRTGRHA